jgi:hypothetical protein
MNNTHKVFEYLQKHKDEMDNICTIMICQLLISTNFNYNHLKKLLKGAYFIIKDNGDFYNNWKKYSKRNKSIYKNCSSHDSCNKQYRIGKNKICNINGHTNYNYDCLIGTICKNKLKHEECNTWFQFERTRLNSITNKLKHSIDYIHHIFSRKNIGPFGKSHNTEDNPIILKLK